MDKGEWLNLGIEQGWISPVYCSTHKPFAFISDEQMEALDRDEEICHHVVAVYE
jgi:hypothetical protein